MADKKAAVRPGPRTGKPIGDAPVLEKIAAQPPPFRAMGERLRALISLAAPALQPNNWYGMPAYARDGKTICFFRAGKQYTTFAFTLDANLAPEKGSPHQLIECAWFFASLDQATEAHLSAIVLKVAG